MKVAETTPTTTTNDPPQLGGPQPTPLAVKDLDQQQLICALPRYAELMATLRALPVGANGNAEGPEDIANREEELLEGWAETIDVDSGERYHCNQATNQTSWERPTAELPDEEDVANRAAEAVCALLDEPKIDEVAHIHTHGCAI